MFACIVACIVYVSMYILCVHVKMSPVLVKVYATNFSGGPWGKCVTE